MANMLFCLDCNVVCQVLRQVYHEDTIILLQSEIPSGMCAKLRTVAASNNREHARYLSSRTLVIVFNRSHINIGRGLTSQSLLLLLARSCHIYNSVILHAHPVRGESHNQRNATREVATILVFR